MAIFDRVDYNIDIEPALLRFSLDHVGSLSGKMAITGEGAGYRDGSGFEESLKFRVCHLGCVFETGHVVTTCPWFLNG